MDGWKFWVIVMAVFAAGVGAGRVLSPPVEAPVPDMPPTTQPPDRVRSVLVVTEDEDGSLVVDGNRVETAYGLNRLERFPEDVLITEFPSSCEEALSDVERLISAAPSVFEAPVELKAQFERANLVAQAVCLYKDYKEFLDGKLIQWLNPAVTPPEEPDSGEAPQGEPAQDASTDGQDQPPEASPVG